MAEPKITINGTQLSEGQAMAIRVAINDFAISLAFGQLDAIGSLKDIYLQRLGEIQQIINR